MNTPRNIIQGASGGLLAGVTLGLAEVGYLAGTAGLPDTLAPLYAVGLYGLVGFGLGLAGGLAWGPVSGIGPVRRRGGSPEAWAFSAGALAAVVPVGGFVAYYLLNRDLFEEKGVPAPALAGLGAAALLTVALGLSWGRNLVQGPLKVLLRGPGVLGAVGVATLATGAFTQVQLAPDPRDGFRASRPAPAALQDKPNVLLIAVDTLRADHLGAYGKADAKTPTLDALAADGIRFDQHIAHASWTRSSFASLFTSRMPSSHNADKKASRLPDDVVMLSEALHDAGVKTANLANNINVSSTFNFDQGYDAFVYESPDYPFGATESVFGLTLYKVLHKLSERIGPKLGVGKDVATFYQPAEVVLGDARAFIEASADARWFLGVHLMEPHDPYFEHPYLQGKGDAEFNGVGYARAEHERPDPKDADYLKAVYADEIRHLDRKLAPFIAWLKETGQYDRTMIVLTADHGEEFDEHGGFWHGTTLYDEQIRVPLLVKLPKGELAGTAVSWQSRAIDVAPTLTAALGVTAGEGWMGKDLLADVRATLTEAAERATARAAVEAQLAAATAALDAATAAGGPIDPTLTEAVDAAKAASAALPVVDAACARYRDPRHRVAVSEEDFEGNVLASIRTGAFKQIVAEPGGPRGLPERELFDVVRDPLEEAELSAAGGSVCGEFVADLPKKLDEDMGSIVSAAQAGAREGGEAALDPAEIKRLCALGYMSGPVCE